jgi:DNA-binding NtrC family response regulator/pSer/pThr/pTyr-binding forkhead associated (FHA) protein
MGKQDTTVRIQESDAIARGPETFWLVAINEGSVQTHLLPEVGTVRIGRAEESDLAVDDPTLSREHAAIHRAPGFELEDLGSANGTRLRGSALAPHQPVTFAPGELIELGSVTLVVVRSTEPLRVGRFWSNRYFEMRLEKRVARGDRAKAFSVIRVHVIDPFPEGRVERVLEGAVSGADVLSSDSAGEYALLLDGAAGEVVARIEHALAGEKGRAQIGAAIFPHDGTTKDALLDVARSRALGSKESAKADHLAAESPPMREVLDLADRAAKGTLSVLLVGETGVGKEIVALRVHAKSPRANRPFIAVNCASLTEALLESALFGYEKGAFAGADRAKPGILEAAHGGTVFLDELAELPSGTQAKLLRVIEQRQVVRLGALTPIPVDVRFVSASNRALDSDGELAGLRRDLLYRLNGFTLCVPPLRERVEEIEPLAIRFAERVSNELGRTPPSIAEPALEMLEGYRWPGNVRELKNVIERAVLIMPPFDVEILAQHLPMERLSSAPIDAGLLLSAGRLLPTRNADSPEAVELARVLEDCAGNQTRAAERLGIARRTLMKRLDKYGFKRPRRRD